MKKLRSQYMFYLNSFIQVVYVATELFDEFFSVVSKFSGIKINFADTQNNVKLP